MAGLSYKVLIPQCEMMFREKPIYMIAPSRSDVSYCSRDGYPTSEVEVPTVVSPWTPVFLHLGQEAITRMPFLYVKFAKLAFSWYGAK